MVDPIVNTTVIVLFGLLIGVVLQAAGALGLRDAVDAPGQRRRDDESYADYVKRIADRGTRTALSLRPAGWVALVSFYGLIAMLIAVVIASPLYMEWLPFLGSLLASFFIADQIFSLAKAGKLRI